MSDTHLVDLVVNQGQDESWQLYWTTAENRPFTLQAPMRMEVRNSVGGIAVTLQTNDTSTDELADPDNQSILYNSETGLIQLQLRATQTDQLAAGDYDYDLFVHYSDPVSHFVRIRRLLAGRMHVNGRVTRSI